MEIAASRWIQRDVYATNSQICVEMSGFEGRRVGNTRVLIGSTEVGEFVVGPENQLQCFRILAFGMDFVYDGLGSIGWSNVCLEFWCKHCCI